MMFRRALFAALVSLAAPLPLAAQDTAAQAEPAEVYTGPVVYRAEVVARYPHDTSAFTQGLLFHDGALFESTGREGESVVRKVHLETGEVLKESPIPEEQFGEGLALWKDELISLTWTDGAIHRWDVETLEPVSTRDDYLLTGWGLTTLGEDLVHSDGSATLRFLDPENYEVRRSLEVTMNGRPLRRLNELEVVDGLIYANIFLAPYIVVIDPADGVVRGLVDLRDIALSVPMSEEGAVLNGIAWDAENRRLFVTGKLWPELFEIRLVETPGRVQ